MNVSAEQNILTLSKASCCAEWLFIVFFMCMSNCSTALKEYIKTFSIAEMVSLCGNIAEGMNVLELVFKTCFLLIIFESANCASARAGLLCTKNRTSWSTKCGWSETKCMFLLKTRSNKSFYRLWRNKWWCAESGLQKDQNLIIQRSQKVQIQLWERQRWQLQTISIPAIEILGFPWNFCLNPPAGTCDF